MSDTKNVLIMNMEDRLHNIGNIVTLNAGMNTIPVSKWEECKKIALVVEHYLKNGIFKVIEESVSKENPILGLSTAKAIATVQATFDPDMLKDWLGSEKRSEVVESIRDQLEMIDLRTRAPEAKV